MKRELYAVEGDKIVRNRRFCPRCGPGVFLAEHENRYSCGNCKYTEIKKPKKEEKVSPAPQEGKEKTEKKTKK